MNAMKVVDLHRMMMMMMMMMVTRQVLMVVQALQGTLEHPHPSSREACGNPKTAFVRHPLRKRLWSSLRRANEASFLAKSGQQKPPAPTHVVAPGANCWGLRATGSFVSQLLSSVTVSTSLSGGCACGVAVAGAKGAMGCGCCAHVAGAARVLLWSGGTRQRRHELAAAAAAAAAAASAAVVAVGMGELVVQNRLASCQLHGMA
eukprot:753197-Pelagomonas_calceolata.AAC.4